MAAAFQYRLTPRDKRQVGTLIRFHMSVTHQWQVLSRPDCSLCETLLQELIVLLGDAAAQVQVIDVSDFPDLERKYGHRIPVLLVDGEFLCDYRLDSERVTQYLAGF